MIKVENLEFKYDNNLIKNVLNGVDINIENGEFVAVLGHNGSGKSTLAKHFNAVLLPCGGNVYIKDMDTKDEKLLFDIRQTIGMVFQNPDNQIVATIVEEDVAFAPENLGVPSDEIRKRVDYALETVGMSEYKRHAPHLLSGGQKQRIAIAGVLAMEPDCIVLDEPTAMLDPIGRREVISTLKLLNKKGITIILITHNMDEATVADRVIVMNKGNIIMDNTPRSVFSKVEELKSMGLDVPQVTELMYELKKSGFDVKTDVLTIDEAYNALAPIIKCNTLDSYTYKSNEAKSQPIIDVQNVCYDYSVGGPFEKRALNDVSLTINKGEIVGIIGHTGSGKSTLAQHFNGLLKPTNGTVLIDRINIADKSTNLKEIRYKVGLVFQYPEHQLFEETVRLDIAFGPKNMGLSQQEIDKRVIDVAKAVGIDDEILDKSPFELSGGQKRRVAIAGVLAMMPDVLVLDEPTAGLDPHGREEILKQVVKMHNELGITVILVSHGMEDIAKTVSKLYVMNKGKIAMSGSPLEVYSQYKELEKIGLTSPQVTKLLDMLCNVNICTVNEAKNYLIPLLQGGRKNA